MREIFTSGSVGGAPGNRYFYLEGRSKTGTARRETDQAHNAPRRATCCGREAAPKEVVVCLGVFRECALQLEARRMRRRSSLAAVDQLSRFWREH